jgi:hypothetical protein
MVIDVEVEKERGIVEERKDFLKRMMFATRPGARPQENLRECQIVVSVQSNCIAK